MRAVRLKIGIVGIEIQSDTEFELENSLQQFAVTQFPKTGISVVGYHIQKKALELPEDCLQVSRELRQVFLNETHVYRRYVYTDMQDGKLIKNAFCVRSRHCTDTYILYLQPDTQEIQLSSYMIPLEEIMVYRNGFVLHSSCIAYQGKAVLFTAPSGTGKTTQAELWEKYAGAEIINGDRCVLQQIDGNWYACGCFYKGSSSYCKSVCLPVAAIIALGQGKENRSFTMTDREKFKIMYRESLVHSWNADYVNRIMDILKACISSVFMISYVCLPQENAVTYMKKKLFPKDSTEQQTDLGIRTVDTKQYMELILELLAEGKEVPLTITGSSMLPFLVSGRDIILLSPIKKEVRRGDIILFRRDNGQFVVHRIRHYREEGYYFLGDAQQVLEGPIDRKQLLGVVTRVKRKGKWIQAGNPVWDFFAYIWIYMAAIRPLFWKLYSIIKK